MGEEEEEEEEEEVVEGAKVVMQVEEKTEAELIN